jgi:hypothetical protein
MHEKHRVRLRLVRLLPRSRLDNLAKDVGVERPWIAARDYLEGRVLAAWSAYIYDEIIDYIAVAK